MRVFPPRIERPHDVAVQSPHDADARHIRPSAKKDFFNTIGQKLTLRNDRLWRKAIIVNIGGVRCGTRYEIEMISRF
jgi:hypothetical protein